MADKKFRIKPQDLIKRYEAAKAGRHTYDSHCEEVAKFMLPNFEDFISSNQTPGAKRGLDIFDNTAMTSLLLFSGALHSMLVSPNAQWFGLTTQDQELDNDLEVAAWLEDCADRMHNVFNNSNFQTEVHPYFLSNTGFGTAAMSVDEDPVDVVRFLTHHMKDIYIEENHQGIVDRVYRRLELTGQGIMDMFPDAKLSEEMKMKLQDSKTSEKKYEVIHAVYPGVEFKAMGDAPFPFWSQYVLVEFKAELSLSGFREKPYIVSRWLKVAGEVNGRGLGMTALPEAKTVNKMVELMIKAGMKSMDPPLLVPDSGYVLPLRTYPGAVNFKRAGSQDTIEKLPTADQRVEFGFELIQEHRRHIREAFFVDQLIMPDKDRMTTVEVNKTVEQQFRFLGPMIGRQHVEFLRPLVDRVFGIMLRRNMFKEVPQKILDKQKDTLGVNYTSPIARMQLQSRGDQMMRFLASLQPYGAIMPEIYDNLEPDSTALELAHIYGYPKKLFRDPEQRDEMRDARAQQAQQQQQLDSQLKQADAMSKASNSMGAMNGG